MWGLSPVAASRGLSSSRCAGLSLSRPLLLRSTGSRRAGSVIVAHGRSCSAARGIFPDQGSNPCPLHWQADSQPLRHQGSHRKLFKCADSQPHSQIFCLMRAALGPRGSDTNSWIESIRRLFPHTLFSSSFWHFFSLQYPVHLRLHWGTQSHYFPNESASTQLTCILDEGFQYFLWRPLPGVRVMELLIFF